MKEEGHQLDIIDLKILRVLQENCRVTNLELSNLVGLSPSPTLERVKRLEKTGCLKSYHAFVNEKVLGIGVVAFIQISLARQVSNAIEKFKQQILLIPEITECYQVTGDADYLLKVMVSDILAFEKLISNTLSNIEEIGQMKTTMILSKVKEQKIVPHKYDKK